MERFPINPFEDILPNDFNKLNKKNVTEDFVEENFRQIGWNVYKPFTDTGIDRIIAKFVCPNLHTKYNQNLDGENCPICKERSVEIFRFIQVKTRELKKNVFGFTLKSKDIRIDPRHSFLLYSDKTKVDQQDFLIIPISIYLTFFLNNNINPFSSTSFRKGNNKVNDLRYNPQKDQFNWGKYSWEQFRNEKGLMLLQNPQIDFELNTFIERTRYIASNLLNKFSRGRTL